MEKINWGIIGLGNIAQSFSEGFLNVNNARLLAISSNNISKLEIPTGNPLIIKFKNDIIDKAYYLDSERKKNLLIF